MQNTLPGDKFRQLGGPNTHFQELFRQLGGLTDNNFYMQNINFQESFSQVRRAYITLDNYLTGVN